MLSVIMQKVAAPFLDLTGYSNNFLRSSFNLNFERVPSLQKMVLKWHDHFHAMAHP
jgi:hypothetical protein